MSHVGLHIPSSLLPAVHSTTTYDGASPSAEASGLLSLPWEMVTHIASHLPAQCVITVLPKVSFKDLLALNFHITPFMMSCRLILLLTCVESVARLLSLCDIVFACFTVYSQN